jgi:predicted dienelactone hydrolase
LLYAGAEECSMVYNSFVRGAAPVGVRTIHLHDVERDVTLPVEIWYPAPDRYRGQDLDPATRDRLTPAPGFAAFQNAVRDAAVAAGRFPLLMHNHGAYGYRQVNSMLCTHLASHGYIVASNDVPGNTLADLVSDIDASRRGESMTSFGRMDVFANRFAYASFVIESLIAGANSEIASRIDATRIGAFGQSAGGWTTLGLNQINPRMRASFAMEPLWGRRSPLGLEELGHWLQLAKWGRDVPTFVLAGELDPLIILQDLRELFEQLPAPKRFASLRGASHWHMGDNAELSHETFRGWYLTDFPDRSFGGPEAWRALGVAMRPFAELCPADHALDTIRSLCLAHMDAHLKGNAEAAAFLDGDLTAAFARRGIALDEVAVEHAGLTAGAR